MKIQQFDYLLPDNLIASVPVSPRDHSKLMVLNRKNRDITHRTFYELPSLLEKGDVLVFNQTKVFPGRLYGHKSTGGKCEVLLLKPLSNNSWEAISRPGLKVGQSISFESKLVGKVINKLEETIEIEFPIQTSQLMEQLLVVGKTPLPPYIKNGLSEERIREVYQTVYAKDAGSIAAPTAGFHFTKELLEKLGEMGIRQEFVELKVGLGTFKSVKVENITQHKMHREWYELTPKTSEALNSARKSGNKIYAVGTTVARVLESSSDAHGILSPSNGETGIFIYPPYKFKSIDGIITNFHLPRTTLLMLVAGFTSFPNTPEPYTNFSSSFIGEAYENAIKHGYRFFSFGDSMFIS
jgi:S-adenosylmethionine:tRNA ribosyltransferase-isomerase